MLHKIKNDDANPNTILRRSITALCAPAVVALMASHAPLAQADTAPIIHEMPYDYVVPTNDDLPRFRVKAPRTATTDETPRFVGRHSDNTDDFHPPGSRAHDDEDDRDQPKATGPVCELETPSFVASPDVAETTANTAVTIYVLQNDTFPENQAPTVSVNGSAHGADVRVNDNGTITYTPARDFTGTDTFEYTIQGNAPVTGYSPKKKPGYGKPSTTTVTVTVTAMTPPPVNTAVIAVDGMPVDNGGTFNVADQDAAAGEDVRFDGSQSILATGKTPTRFRWLVNGVQQQDAALPTFNFKLADGTSQVTLIASDGEVSATSTVTVAVAAPPRMNTAVIAIRDGAQDRVITNGGSFNLADTDTAAGETITFDGSKSLLATGQPPTSFQWLVNGVQQQAGASNTFTVKLPDGTSQVELIAGDGEVSATSTVSVTVAAPPTVSAAVIIVDNTPVANGGTVAVSDADFVPGETKTFDGSKSTLSSGKPPTNFKWYVNGTLQQDDRLASFTFKLNDGTSQVRLVASDGEVSAASEVTVMVTAPQVSAATITVNGTPVANGDSFSLADSDGAPGESPTFNGAQTVLPDQSRPTRFRWFVNDIQQQDGPNGAFVPKLADGNSRVTLIASRSIGEGAGEITAVSTVNIAVAAVVAPTLPSTATILVNGTAIINGAITLADTDAAPGEKAKFDGSQSSVAGARPTRFQWFVNDVLQKDGRGDDSTFEFRLNDGASSVRLVASNGAISAASNVNVTVGAVAILADIPNLTPNQRSVAKALDNICSQLLQRSQNNQALSTDQSDLLDRCRGILLASPADQSHALDELSAQDFNAARLQTLLFTNSLYAGVMDRLMALRGGVRGLSLAGLDVVIDGKSVPLAELQEMFGHLLGGSAGADDEPGSLLGDKWGAWSRGNFTFGSKDASQADKGFNAKQYSLTAGMDYRLSDKMVLGGAVAFGSSNISYDPNGEGGLDTKTWAVSIYGSRYAAKNFYVDALANAANSSYDAHRHIGYDDAFGTVQRDARGNTDGLTLSGGLSGGYDFLFKGLTLSPNAGFFYVDSKINGFREGGSRGLNLIYDQQTFQSLTTTLGVRVNYAWNLPFGVLVPYFRGDYVHELKNDVEAFNVHFANDPGNPTTPIAVKSDDPDQSYFRLVAGLSGQFPFGISGYVEYQRLQGFQFVSFNDLSLGLRMQYRY